MFQIEQVQRDGNEEHKVEYHKEHMGRNDKHMVLSEEVPRYNE